MGELVGIFAVIDAAGVVLDASDQAGLIEKTDVREIADSVEFGTLDVVLPVPETGCYHLAGHQN